MSLEDLHKANRLRAEGTSREEISGLLGIVDRSLRDAAVEAISDDLRLMAAYNALLTSASIPLRATGYRVPNQSGHHILTFETLQFTIGADAGLIRRLKAFAAQRGKAAYDFAGAVSKDQLRGALRAAHDLQSAIMKWLASNKPELIGK